MKRDPLGAVPGERPGDAQASPLAALYARWRKPLVRLLQGRFGDRAQAEDTAQQVFAQMAASGHLPEAGKEQAYLSRAASNLAVDQWRQRGARQALQTVSADDCGDALQALAAGDGHDPQWSAYASYSSIFKPQSLLNEAGQNLKPITGDTYEVGIKGELMDKRVNTSLAIYRVNQNHRAQEDLSSSPTCSNGYYCYIDTGKVSSQGLDAEISGELARGWKLFTGYTYNTNKYTRDNNNQGKTVNTYTPRHLLRVWTTYRLPGEWSDFTIGGGVNAQSSNYRQVGAVAVQVPGYAIWNSHVRYRINRQWEATLNFNNMFDKTYYVSVGNLLNSSHYGEPRNVMLTLRGTF